MASETLYGFYMSVDEFRERFSKEVESYRAWLISTGKAFEQTDVEDENSLIEEICQFQLSEDEDEEENLYNFLYDNILLRISKEFIITALDDNRLILGIIIQNYYGKLDAQNLNKEGKQKNRKKMEELGFNVHKSRYSFYNF